MQNNGVPTPHPSTWDIGGPLTICSVFGCTGVPPASGMLFGGLFDPRYYKGEADLVFADPARHSDAQTIIDEVRNHPYPFADFTALWQANLTPVSVSLLDALNSADYYSRSGFTFLPRLADFHIEWTDGRRIDPLGPDGYPLGDPRDSNDNDTRTRWFGLAPERDPATPPDPNNPVGTIETMNYQARMRAIASSAPKNPSNPNPLNPDNDTAETAAFANIEYGYDPSGSVGVSPKQYAGYRAVWRTDNWQYRPKALRFTFRLYDAGNRIQSATTIDLDENGTADPNNVAIKPLITRSGQEFSIVVAVP